MASPRRLARLAGLLYLLLALFTGAPFVYVGSSIVAAGDAATTADNVVANAGLLRLSLVAELAGMTCYILVAMAFYRLLRHVNQDAAAAMVVFTAIGAAIMGTVLLNTYAALAVATDPSLATTLGTDASDQLVLTLFGLREHGNLIAQVFFGLWLLPLGYLAYRSGYFPKGLAVLLVVGGVAYLVDLLARFLLPDLGADLSPFPLLLPTAAELWMVGYLLVKGVRTIPPQQTTPAPVPAVA
jgi:hypothetical protein